MTVTPRQRRILALVDRLGQVTAAHLDALVFADNASHTPRDRELKRMIDNRLLTVTTQRRVTSARGGSGALIYVVGQEGWRALGRGGTYYRPKINYHTLAIADVFVALQTAEKAGRLRVVHSMTEPDSWVAAGDDIMKPDLHVELEIPGKPALPPLLLEIDLGTERQRHIKDKLARYWRSRELMDASTFPVFPVVVFLAPDAERVRELRWMIDHGKPEARRVFRVYEIGEFPEVILS